MYIFVALHTYNTRYFEIVPYSNAVRYIWNMIKTRE